MTLLRQSKVLIVDDTQANISMLFDFLNMHDLNVLIAKNGEKALQIAEEQYPSLILLDVMMPGIDGFETCRRLKANPTTQDIPIIFMTALSDTESKVRGLELGAVDYVTKPFQPPEVLARINAHLTVRHLQEELKIRNEELDSFAHTVAHDLKNPLHGMISLTDLVINRYPSGEVVDEQAIQYLQYVVQAGKKLESIINSLLMLAGVSRRSPPEMQPIDMKHIIEQVLEHRLAYMLQRYECEMILPKQWLTAIGYAPWIEEIWSNYISNALKYGGKPPVITLGSDQRDNMIRFWVQDNGTPLTPAQQSKLFKPFARLHENTEGHGLGLSIVQRIAERLNGQVGIEPLANEGNLFYFTLPPQQPHLTASFQDELLIQLPIVYQTKLLDLAMCGDVNGLLRCVDEISPNYPETIPILNQIRDLAKTFNLRDIRIILEKHIKHHAQALSTPIF